MKTASLGVLITVIFMAACNLGLPQYRASGKLFVTRKAGTTEVADEHFYATATEIMRTQSMLRRVQVRMRKTPQEIGENLTKFDVSRMGKADILLVAVVSPSRDFARDFVNAIMDEYLKFRDEQRAKSNESASLELTRQINRLSAELKAKDAEITAYANAHGTNSDSTLDRLYGDRNRIHKAHEASLIELLKRDTSAEYEDLHQVTIMEYALFEK